MRTNNALTPPQKRIAIWALVLSVPIAAFALDAYLPPFFYLLSYLLPLKMGKTANEKRSLLAICALISVAGTVSPALELDHVFLFRRGAVLTGQMLVFVPLYYALTRTARIDRHSRQLAYNLYQWHILAKLSRTQAA